MNTDKEKAAARLWPNREHESNWLKNLCCAVGLHRWQAMKFESGAPVEKATYCRWCSAIRMKA